MSDRVALDVHEHVATLTLDRAEKMNALDPEMFEAIPAAAREIAGRDDIRAVVVAGAGGNFSAGLDVAGFGGADLAAAFAEDAFVHCGDTPANRYQYPAWALFVLPVPVIAAIEGVCFGGGVQIAAGADIRIAAPDARLSIMEMKWGLVPDMAFTAVMRHVMPLDRLKTLVYTARVIDGRQARELGLVTDTSPEPLVAAQSLAAEIAGCSPDAVRAAKALCNAAFDQAPAAALRLEAEAQHGLMGQPNQVEAVMANLQKRAPDFA